ncbi:unnamed protein product [Didymodactylos carnosus]|uniref:Uncharacterized protein n=1 Tax=Didymodactylos carnosus TaxID=1234261 RepID=A0A814G3N0_9BILA|nr:unnamed protein product [Didymodactylos carnosus]CAF0990958.1 unnamed protein product [Didymodactylos carnosus]CAF3722302.1 unnamed protein product [Didymodactylos carnosus]CAF3762881.1 unnamed protein product [Didymodactylos carnosus]
MKVSTLMGKIRRERTKIHYTAPKTLDLQNDEQIDEPNQVDVIEEELEHNSNDFDKRSVISNKTLKSLVAKKKDKQKLKHELFMKRLDTAYTAKKQEKERNARKKTVIVSDMKYEFEQSLPQIEKYLDQQRLSIEQNKSTKNNRIPTQKKRIEQFQTNVQIFDDVLKSKKYLKNPFSVIKKNLEEQIQLTKK